MPRFGHAGIIALCLAGLVVNAYTLGPSLKYTARGVTDFMDLYAGGNLAFSNGLYVPARVLETEARTEGSSSPTRLFMRLPCFALLFWPLAQLPYPAASAIWEALCLAGIVVFVLLWPKGQRRHAAVACCWSLPLWMTVAEGQDIGFLLLWIAIAMALVRKRRLTLAGAVASLCIAKFQLFLLIPVWICARKQWRFARGLLAGCAALVALSFAANGWSWPLRYLTLLREPANNPYHEAMPNLLALFEGVPHEEALGIFAAIALAILIWIACRRRHSQWSFAATLAGSLLIAPHDFMADCAILIPAALPLLNSSAISLQTALYLYLVTPIPWILLLAGSGGTTRLALCAFVLSAAWDARAGVSPKSETGS